MKTESRSAHGVCRTVVSHDSINEPMASALAAPYRVATAGADMDVRSPREYLIRVLMVVRMAPSKLSLVMKGA